MDEGARDQSVPPLEDAADGSVIGVAGVEGWMVARQAEQLEAARRAVSPLTWRGTLHVLLLLTGVVAVVAALSAIDDRPRLAWLLLAIVLTGLVARRGYRRRRSS